MELPFVLDWLARQVQTLIYLRCGTAEAGAFPGIRDSVLKRMDRRNLFCYLDTINRLRAQPAGSFKGQLALEGLLIDLAGSLDAAAASVTEEGMRHVLGQR